MASQPESRIPAPGGLGNKEKRRSFLPAPKRSSGIPAPSGFTAPAPATAVVDVGSQLVKPPDLTRQEPPLEHKPPKEHRPPKEHKPAPPVEDASGGGRLPVGRRVLIGGVKPGILRYVGKTHIAPGLWCGVELFDASGLHDGEVDGKRYFSCKPFRGIFAPLDKVELDNTVPESKEATQQIQSQSESRLGKSRFADAKPEKTADSESGHRDAAVEEKSGGSRIPAPRSQIARLSAVPRANGSGGFVKSSSAEPLGNRDKPGQQKAAAGGSATDLNSTFTLDDSDSTGNRPRTVSEGSDTDGLNQTYSCTVEKQLQSDSRRYFNITFNRDGPPPGVGASHLPDVVSSASPSPPSREGGGKTVQEALSLNKTQSAQDIAHALACDMSLGLLEPDILADDTNLLEGVGLERSSTGTSNSESDISRSNSSTLDDASCATVAEVVTLTSTPLQGQSQSVRRGLEKGGTSSGSLCETDSDVSSPAFAKAKAGEEIALSDVKRNLGQTFSATSPAQDSNLTQTHRRDSSSSNSNSASADVSFPQKQELLQEEGSNGISPEVSQVLEWDYDHDAFDGKLLEKSAESMSMSTSTSESCSEASADPGGLLADKALADVERAPSEADQFEETEDGFENIDDFPLGLSRDTKHLMTDSGISEKGFADDPVSKRRSVEFDSRVHVVGPSGDKVEMSATDRVRSGDAMLMKDLEDGHSKKDRPLSLVSTTSADTGYVPDTDSEAGTPTNSEMLEKNVSSHPDSRAKTAAGVAQKQASIEGGAKEVETDSDAYSEAGNTLHETEGPSDVDEGVEHIEAGSDSEESESEEEDEEHSDSDEDDEVDDLPEDERIEADRSTSGGRQAAPRSATAVSGAAVASLAVGARNEMTESANLQASDMTESATRVNAAAAQAHSEAGVRGQGGEDQTGDNAVQQPCREGVQNDSAVAPEGAKTGSQDNAGGDNTPSQTTKQKGKRSSSASKKNTPENKKVKVKPATSRLADYINAPLPTKPPEEKKAEKKIKKNNVSKLGKGTPADKAKGSTQTLAEEKEKEKKPTPVKEEKPKVKRVAPKSKWDNIMSKIEASKDTVKVKPKSEIKSSLAIYLSTPATPTAKDNSNNPSPTANTPTIKKEANKKEDTPKPKVKLVNHPKPDFSNIKSKLNISAPPPKPSTPRRDSSPGVASVGSTPKNTTPKKPTTTKNKQGKLQVGHSGLLESADTWSVRSQAASSTTDLSVFDVADGGQPSSVHTPSSEQKRNSISRAAPRLKNERASSVASSRSDRSTPRSVKANNTKNAQKTDSNNRRTSGPTSSIPPPTPRRAQVPRKPPVPSARELAIAAAARDREAKTTAPSNRTPKPTTNSNNQTRSRSKASSQLKSGQPPDVVSTSARGTRAQEVARLESLCETRTKELNYTKMQLKSSLQAFDAMACLLNYCTNHLDAFSCPEMTAKLKTAEGTLSEQQKEMESLAQQKAELEQKLTEVTQAREAAQNDISRLEKEVKEAEEAHIAALQQLKEVHSTALSSQQENLQTQHEQATQQLQNYHAKQLEYTKQSHQRQISELTAEHQMATNQLKVAHLEEIQELRNKHDKQMEDLHAQHRNKLEDITRRFESIKISLSEKVESLCLECEDLRIRARTSEEALQRDADVKVQLALAPFMHLPKEIESLKTVIDMKTEEIQKLRQKNMDLEKQLEELPIAQEKVTSLQQKVENLQAIINIKSDHEKQLHEKCQVLMRKYDRESRANKRLSMDYEQVVWRMSQSADFTGSTDLLANPLSRSPTRSGEQVGRGSPSPVRRSISHNAQGDAPGVTRRQRKTSGGDEDFDRKIRCRSATFVMDKAKVSPLKNGTGTDSNGSESMEAEMEMDAFESVTSDSDIFLSSSVPASVMMFPSKKTKSKSSDRTEEIVAAVLSASQDESWSSGHFSADPSDLQSSLQFSMEGIQSSQDGIQSSMDGILSIHEGLQDGIQATPKEIHPIHEEPYSTQDGTQEGEVSTEAKLESTQEEDQSTQDGAVNEDSTEDFSDNSLDVAYNVTVTANGDAGGIGAQDKLVKDISTLDNMAVAADDSDSACAADVKVVVTSPVSD